MHSAPDAKPVFNHSTGLPVTTVVPGQDDTPVVSGGRLGPDRNRLRFGAIPVTLLREVETLP
jgi:hypothetical protein